MLIPNYISTEADPEVLYFFIFYDLFIDAFSRFHDPLPTSGSTTALVTNLPFCTITSDAPAT